MDKLQTNPPIEADKAQRGIVDRALVWLGKGVVARPVLVIALWSMVVVAGFLASGKLGSVIANSFSGPQGSESHQVDALLHEHFPRMNVTSAVVLVRAHGNPITDDYYQRLRRELERVPEVDQVLLPQELGAQARLDARTCVVLLSFKQASIDQAKVVPALRERIREAKAPPGVEALLTAEMALTHDGYEHAARELLKVEQIGLALSLLVLLYVFGGWFPALLPLLSGIAVLAVSNGVLVMLAHGFETTTFNQMLTAVLALALGIDYPLFMIARLREEIGKDRSLGPAMERTMLSTGKALLTSGGVVIAASACMALVDISGLRPAAISASAAVVASWLASATLLPAIIAVCDRRWPAALLLRNRFHTESGDRRWERFVAGVVRRPLPVLLACGVLLGGLAWPVLSAKLWSPNLSVVPSTLESAKGLQWLMEYGQAGHVSPLLVVIDTEQAQGVYSPSFLTGLDSLVRELRADPRVARVDSMVSFRDDLSLSQYLALYRNPFMRGGVAEPLVNGSKGASATLLRIISSLPPDSEQARGLVEDLRTTVLPRHSPGLRAKALVGGHQAYFVDLFHAFSKALPWMIGLNFLAIGLLLAWLLRSVVLPIKAILTNLLPVLAAFGAVVAVFQYGVGASWLGATPTGYVMLITPTILLTVLYAISMDYELMILSRIREAYDRTGDNARAIAEGVSQMGRVVLGGALILLSVFAAYLFADFGLMKEIGLALSVAIVIDATIVRLLLLPSAMVVMGRWNYWVPTAKDSLR